MENVSVKKMGWGSSAPLCTVTRGNGTQGPAVTVMGNVEQKEENGKKYITFAGATSTKTCGLLSGSHTVALDFGIVNLEFSHFLLPG